MGVLTLCVQPSSRHHVWVAPSPSETLTSPKQGLETPGHVGRRAWHGGQRPAFPCAAPTVPLGHEDTEVSDH